MTENRIITIVREVRHFKRTDLKGFKGFTLAEVLITLVIIGVIAAMTIPTLMNNTNNQEYISRLKKAYSTMAQVTQRIISDEGMPQGSIGGWATSSEAVFNLYTKYLSNAKICGKDITGCFEGTYKKMNGTPGNYDSSNGSNSIYTFVMADGTEVSIQNGHFGSTCALNGNGSTNVCQFIVVDVNGAKGPNTVGKDAFAFSLKNDGLHPTGCDTNAGACSNSSIGWGCTCRALREGAINYL